MAPAVLDLVHKKAHEQRVNRGVPKIPAKVHLDANPLSIHELCDVKFIEHADKLRWKRFFCLQFFIFTEEKNTSVMI